MTTRLDVFRRGCDARGVRLRPIVVCLLAAGLAPAFAQTLPTGFKAIGGGVTMSQPGIGTMNIMQSTVRAMAQWNSFSIGAGGIVNIAQPGPASVLLNRVVGPDASTIAGRLNANGQVFLVNPNGVLFSKGSVVNTGGLVASTLDIGNDNFMAGKQLVFERADGNHASVVNAGSIHASKGGTVALMGETVRNEGDINVASGTIGLVSGRQVAIDFAGDGLTTFRVSTDVKATNALAENAAGATLTADGGRVAMLAVGSTPSQWVVNQQGTVQAHSLVERNGEIILGGGSGNDVRVAGTLDATGAQAGLKGGSVSVDGGRVLVDEGALIDASGSAGGGSIRVHASDAAVVLATSSMRSDAMDKGDGGKVGVFGDGTLQARGPISARGGPNGGNGGFVETSGGSVDLGGLKVDTSAATGKVGEWLLDPGNITIWPGTFVGGEFPCGASACTYQPADPFPPAGPAVDSDVFAFDIAAALVNNDVTITTGNTANAAGNITFQPNAAIDYAGSQGRTLQFIANNNIEFPASTSIKSSGGALLNVNMATTDLKFGGGSINYGGEIGTNRGHVQLTASSSRAGGISMTDGSIATNGGGVDFSGTSAFGAGISMTGGTITTNGGNVGWVGTSGSGAGISMTGGSITTSEGNVAWTGTSSTGPGILMAGVDIAASTGSVTMKGDSGGAAGITLSNGRITTDGGQVSLDGTGSRFTPPPPPPPPTIPGDTGGPITGIAVLVFAPPPVPIATEYGLELNNFQISSGSGSVSLRGTGRQPTGENAVGIGGVRTENGSSISTTTGNVAITGTVTSDSVPIAGITLVPDARGVTPPAVTTKSGNITLSAQSQSTVDAIDIGAPVRSESGAIHVRRNQADGFITLGGADRTDTFVISQAELNQLAAPNISFGSQDGANPGVTGVQVVGPITLPAPRNLTFQTGPFGSLQVNSDMNLNGGSLALIGGAGGTITQTGSITADSLAVFSPALLRAANNVVLTNPGNAVNTLAANVAANLEFTNTGTLSVGTVGYTLADGTRAQIAGVTAGGAAVVRSSGGSVVLAAPVVANDVSLLGANGIAQGSAGGITSDRVLAIAQNGSVTLNAATNNVLTVAGSATNRFDFSGAGAVTIGKVASSDPQQPIVGNGISADIVDVLAQGSGLTVGQAVTGGTSAMLVASTGDLNLNAPVNAPGVGLAALGNINQASAGGITANVLVAEANTGDVNLSAATNHVNAVGGVAGGRFDFTNADPLSIDQVGVQVGRGTDTPTELSIVGPGPQQQFFSADGLAANAVRVRTVEGALSVDSDVVVTATGILQAGGSGSLALNAPVSASNLALDAASIDQATTGSLSVGSGLIANARNGDVALTTAVNKVGTVAGGATGRFDFDNTGSLSIGAVTVADTQQPTSANGITADALRVRALTGDFSVDQAVTARSNAVLQSNAGNLSLNAATDPANLALLANGSISQTAAGGITAGGLLVRSTTGDVNLSAGVNHADTLAGSAAGRFDYTDADSLAIGPVSVLAQPALLRAGPAAPLFEPGSGVTGNAVRVRTSGGDLDVNVAVTSASTAILQAGGFGNLALNASVSASNLALDAASIDQATTGSLSVGSGLIANARNGDVALTTAVNKVGTVAGGATGRFDFDNTGSLSIGAVTVADTQQPTSANGITADALRVRALTGDFSVDQAVTARTNAVLQSSAGNLSLNAATDPANLALLANGSISQTAAGGITAGGLLVRSTTGDVNLSAGVNHAAALAGSAAGRFDYTDADSLAIGPVSVLAQLAVLPAGPAAPLLETGRGVTGNAVRVRTSGGDLDISAPVASASTAILQAGGVGNLALNAPVSATDLSIDGNGIAQSSTGTLTVTNGLLATARGGDVSLNAAGVSTSAVAGGAAGRFDFTNAGALTVGAVNVADAQQSMSGSGLTATDLNVNAMHGDLMLAGNVSATSAAGLHANGSVTQASDSGGLGKATAGDDKTGKADRSLLAPTSPPQAIVAASLQASSDTGDVLLDNPANQVGTVAGRAAGRFDFANAGALTVAGVSADTVRVRNLDGDMTLAGKVNSATSADLVTAGRLQNTSGSAITGGTWRVWAQSWEGETRGGLAGSGRLPNLYHCSYGGACGVSVSNNDDHFIYTQQPVLTLTAADLRTFAGQTFPAMTYGESGLILGDTGVGIKGALSTPATPGSPAGRYAINGKFTSEEGYAINFIPGSLVLDLAPPAPPDVVREDTNTYTFDRNLGPPPICFATGSLDGDRVTQQGDVLGAEWTRVRSRPNLLSCVSDGKRNGCSDF
ncbi:filamentous hemagglutinin N-terminal domain-containing protein [Variovorax sp. dw_954]|uniref:two-partner secretion domain-containing protein n=1 Tax=Variovorax sp. dw_954 TaxID=2720078 RepID=UPI001BD539D1|nr:filamentous hemagglutinin N-terminal domain-containing protein [Variovorax sp. dw_954]